MLEYDTNKEYAHMEITEAKKIIKHLDNDTLKYEKGDIIYKICPADNETLKKGNYQDRNITGVLCKIEKNNIIAYDIGVIQYFIESKNSCLHNRHFEYGPLKVFNLTKNNFQKGK